MLDCSTPAVGTGSGRGGHVKPIWVLIIGLLVACAWLYGPEYMLQVSDDDGLTLGALPADVAAELDAQTGPPKAVDRAGQSRTGPKELRPGMKWLVTGAGDATYNGIYEQDGIYNGQPTYTNGVRWLYNNPLMSDTWALSGNIGDILAAYIDGPTLPGTWFGEMGCTPPIPTVAEYLEPPPDPGETTSLQRGFVPQTTGSWGTTLDPEVKPGRYLKASPAKDHVLYMTRYSMPLFPIYDVDDDTWATGTFPARPGLETYAANRIALLDSADEATLWLIFWTDEWDGLALTQYDYEYNLKRLGFPVHDYTWNAPQAFDEVSNFVLDGAGFAWFVGVWNNAGDKAYDLYSIDLSNGTVALQKAWRVTADVLALSGAELAGHEPLVYSGTSGEFYLLRTDGVSTYVHSLSTTTFELTGNPIPVSGVQRSARDATTGYLHVGTENADIGRWDTATGQGWACMRSFVSGRLYYAEGTPFGAACV